MSLRNLLKHRSGIYGFLTVWIILFHVNRRLGEPIQIPVLAQFLTCGNIAVDIFMFISGCCLYLSMERKPDVKRFYMRRVRRMLPSYLILTLPFWFWRSLVEAPKEGGGFHFVRFFADLSSASFWLKGVETTWFVFAIFAFYLMFPLIFRAINKGIKASAAMLIAVYVVNVTGIHLIPIYDESSIAWTRLPVFIIGAMAGKYIDSLDPGRLKKKTQICLLGGASAVVILFLFIFPLNSIIDGVRIPSEYMWLLYGPVTVCLVTLLSAVLGLREKGTGVICRTLEAIGEVSLEMYMSHITVLHWFTYYGWLGRLGMWSFIVLLLIATVASWLVHRIDKRILYRIENNY